MTFITNLGQP